MRSEFDRWLDKVEKTDSCWNWTGVINRRYGSFRRFLDGKWKMYKAHRYAYEYYKGEIPKGMFVCHSCDNPKCVNPEHLWLGTQKENIQDMIQKGRNSFGIREYHNNLTFEIATKIRKAYNDGMTKYAELAKLFNTSKPQICRVIKNKIWKE